ncbi:MAG: glycosyl hydrolase 53 family protein [Sedimentisphaerales bacterium]|nr:glycosyl hydrolase 53 family protein [Sedimentisphaerales bacterium]
MKKNETFAKGADLSLLKRNIDQNNQYYVNNEVVDPIEAFKEAGFNYARLRLFHTPTMHGAQVNDHAYTLCLAKNLCEAGYNFLLNIHYSDTWADPGKQKPPAAWKDMSFMQLMEAVYKYTLNTVTSFIDAGAEPDMVQIGNEITPGILWEHGRIASAHDTNTIHWTKEPSSNGKEAWSRFGDLLKAGIQGVHDATGTKTPILIHIDRGGDQETSQWFFDNIFKQDVPFDVIGQSYYPFWHGMPEDLRDTLDFLAERYGKDLYVVETAYPWKYHTMYENALGGDHEGWQYLKTKYPLSPEGQFNFLEDIIQIVKETKHNRGKGVFYWAPEWISPQHPGIEDEGDAEPCWARALFNEAGHALPAFHVFRESPETISTQKISTITANEILLPSNKKHTEPLKS